MQYEELMAQMRQGWNTWYSGSVLSHVLLPEGLAVSLAVKNYQTGRVVRESLIGRHGAHEEIIHPGPRSYDGAYTELNWKYGGLELLIQSAVKDGEQYLLVTPLNTVLRAPALLVEFHTLWNRPGKIGREGDHLVATLPGRMVELFADGTEIREMHTNIHGQYLSLCLDRPVAVSTGRPVGVSEMAAIMAAAKVVTDKGLIGKVAVTGLGLPSEMAEYITNGSCPWMYLWNPIDVGGLAAYASMALVKGDITGAAGDKFEAGTLGSYEVISAADGGTEVLLGAPFKFDPDNIDEWKSVY